MYTLEKIQLLGAVLQLLLKSTGTGTFVFAPSYLSEDDTCVGLHVAVASSQCPHVGLTLQHHAALNMSVEARVSDSCF